MTLGSGGGVEIGLASDATTFASGAGDLGAGDFASGVRACLGSGVGLAASLGTGVGLGAGLGSGGGEALGSGVGGGAGLAWGGGEALGSGVGGGAGLGSGVSVGAGFTSVAAVETSESWMATEGASVSLSRGRAVVLKPTPESLVSRFLSKAVTSFEDTSKPFCQNEQQECWCLCQTGMAMQLFITKFNPRMNSHAGLGLRCFCDIHF